MPLISPKINDELNKLVGDMFNMNRLLDRQMSVLNIKFVMSDTASILHQKLAHAYPNPLADEISDYQGSRNCMTIYPQTNIGNQEYNSPLDIFEAMLGEQLKIEGNISKVLLFSIDDEDVVTYSFLQKFILAFSKYTEQILLLRDKAKLYAETDDWMRFDKDIENFMLIK